MEIYICMVPFVAEILSSQLIKEMMCQRLSQEFQLLETKNKYGFPAPYIFSMSPHGKYTPSIFFVPAIKRPKNIRSV